MRASLLLYVALVLSLGNGGPAYALPSGIPQDAQLFAARPFVEFTAFSSLASDTIRWDRDSGRNLYMVPNAGFLVIKGTVTKGHELFFENHWIPVQPNGHFEIPVALTSMTKVLHLRIFDGERHFRIYPFIYYWHKLPPLLRFRVQEGNQVVQEAEGLAKVDSRLGFVQLYNGARATQTVDLDAIRDASLTFRIYLPPSVNRSCDRWDLTIEGTEHHEIARVSRIGFPPPYIEWSALRGQIRVPDHYLYHLVLHYGPSSYDGGISRFYAFAGSRSVRHSYAPSLVVEPREELGLFSFTNQQANDFSSAYFGADVALVLKQRVLFEADGFTTLQGLNTTGELTFLRVGAGLRWFDYAEDTWAGRPFLFQLDTLANFTLFSLSPSLDVRHFIAPSVLIEPHLIFWSRHHLVPSLEYAFLYPPNTYQRISAGVRYLYYIPSWSLGLGMGLAIDKMLSFQSAPGLRFQVIRLLTNLSFYL